MNKGIVITTSEHTKDWLPACLDSIKTTPYSVVVQDNGANGGYELAGIQKGKETFDEFIHLMDTVEVKDVSLFDKLFEIPGHIFLTEGGYHFMGKFVSSDLPMIPQINSKKEAIDAELHWLGNRERSYFKPDLPVHSDVFVEKHGRKNMVLENDYLIKYKATWSL